jgi:hypothetical protein
VLPQKIHHDELIQLRKGRIAGFFWLDLKTNRTMPRWQASPDATPCKRHKHFVPGRWAPDELVNRAATPPCESHAAVGWWCAVAGKGFSEGHPCIYQHVQSSPSLACEESNPSLTVHLPPIQTSWEFCFYFLINIWEIIMFRTFLKNLSLWHDLWKRHVSTHGVTRFHGVKHVEQTAWLSSRTESRQCTWHNCFISRIKWIGATKND